MNIIKWENGCNIHTWIEGVPVEKDVILNAMLISEIPFVKHIAIMPDAHKGKGADIGSVIATEGYIVPSLVGADICCGISCVKTSLKEDDIPEKTRHNLRIEIEKNVPSGRTNNGGKGDKGAWDIIPTHIQNIWNDNLKERFENICKKYPEIARSNNLNHLGTIGSSNHFAEISVDEEGCVWVMTHTGSRGIGAKIGSFFTNKAKEFYEGVSKNQKYENERLVKEYTLSEEFKNLNKEEKREAIVNFRNKICFNRIEVPNSDLVYLKEGTEIFDDYLECVSFCHEFAKWNRSIIINNMIIAMKKVIGEFNTEEMISCHHNFVEKETHFDKEWYVTRKGAIMAREGQYGIIPGAMGKATFIVVGKGQEDSLSSASHGAGRVMGRREAMKTIDMEAHMEATKGLECYRGSEIIDESPLAYKDVYSVMKAQEALVSPICCMKAIICVKGLE